MSEWTDPAWRAQADAWIGEWVASLGLTVTGDLDQLHIYPWSTVIRVPTATGDLYFKANAASLRHEAELTRLLSSWRPDCVATLHAVDSERGWMLMADAGVPLRSVVAEERSLARWLDVLPLYASVQIDLMDHADALVAMGVPDLRLAALPNAAEQMFGELEDLEPVERARLTASLPEIRERSAELAAHGIPETIQHDDLHDGQVFVHGNDYVLLDWADACVTHPFFTMAVTLGGVIAWGVDDVENAVDTRPFRDAYLKPFATLPATDLVGACSIATRLGWLCRAVNGHRSGNEPPEKTRVRLSMFLDGHA